MAVSGTVASSAATATAATARLHALLLCDLVDSTGLIERLGDAPAADLIRQHDRLARDCLQRHGGREIDKTDGFLLLFERPIQAVAFALDYVAALQRLARSSGQPLRTRVGIHVGEVLLWRNDAADIADGAKPVEVEGLAKAVAARLMSLARPGQILLSETACVLAQRAAGELGPDRSALRWPGHGRYRLKGVDVPLAVHEVGLRGSAPLRAPPSIAKARRLLPWWKTRWAQAAVVLLALTVAMAMVLRPEPAIAFQARDWVLVGSLRNLTDEPMLGETMRTAFRLALEQSRHVNVLSEMAVSNAVRRAGVEPATPIDRKLGSSLALREGARALLLPSIAEVGGRLRVSVEIIDPHSEVTVYTETAEGDGIDSALPSLDEVAAGVRMRLSEALADIRQQSLPLPKAITPSIEALHGFALADRALAEGRYQDAQALFEQALVLDPDFDLARIGLARIALSRPDIEAARDLLGRVDPARGRLTTRDRLAYDALVAMVDMPPDAVIGRLRLLSQMYPDHFGAYANQAILAVAWHSRYAFGIERLQQALSNKNPLLPATHELLAAAYLATDQFSMAERHLHEAEALGSVSRFLVYTYVPAAQRRFREAEAMIALAAPDRGTANAFRALPPVVLALDRGRWQSASKLAAEAVQAFASPHSPMTPMVELLALTAASFDRTRWVPQRAIEFVDRGLDEARSSAGEQRQQALFHVLAAAYVAARAGQPELFERVIEQVSPLLEPGYPVIDTLQRIAAAEVARMRGDAVAGLALLEPVGADGALYQLRSARLRLFESLGRQREALADAEWLTSHRGLAYGESHGLYALHAMNVADSSQAMLDGAEAALALGDERLAATMLSDFLAHGYSAELDDPLLQRIAQLAARLGIILPRAAAKADPALPAS